MASKQANAIKDLYGSWKTAMGANPEMDLAETRDLFDQWGDITGEPGGVDYIEETCGGVPCLWAVPKGASEDRVLICTHGGGYVVGSMFTHRKMFGHLCWNRGSNPSTSPRREIQPAVPCVRACCLRSGTRVCRWLPPVCRCRRITIWNSPVKPWTRRPMSTAS